MKTRFDPRPRKKNGTLINNKISRERYIKMLGYTPAQWNAKMDAENK